MTGKFFKYVGKGEVGDIIPGVGLVSKEPLQARDETHLKAIEDSGAFEKTAAPKKAPESAPADGDKGEK